MEKAENLKIENALIQNGWMCMTGFLLTPPAFDDAEGSFPFEADDLRKNINQGDWSVRTFYPLNSVMQEQPDHRILLARCTKYSANDTPVYNVDRNPDDLKLIVLQKRNDAGQWINASAHSPSELLFNLGANPDYLLSQHPGLRAFAKIALDKDILRPMVQLIEADKIVLYRDKDSGPALLLDATDKVAPQIKALQFVRQVSFDQVRGYGLNNNSPALTLDQLASKEGQKTLENGLRKSGTPLDWVIASFQKYTR